MPTGENVILYYLRTHRNHQTKVLRRSYETAQFRREPIDNINIIHVTMCCQLPRLHQPHGIRPARWVGDEDWVQRAPLLPQRGGRMAERTQCRKSTMRIL